MFISRMQTKIIAIVVATLMGGFGLLVYMTLQKEETELLAANHSKTELLASAIISSMKTVMNTGQPESASGMVSELRTVSGIKEVRVFNKDGDEIYLDAGYPDPPADVEARVREALATGIVSELKDKRSLTLFKPLVNEESCQGCHGSDHKYQGVLAVSVSLEKVYADIKDHKLMAILNAFAAIALVALLLALWLRRVVLSPIEKAVGVMTQMERDKDLTYRMESGSKDEMGQLAGSFNSFIDSVQRVVQRINRMSYQVGSVSTQIVVNSAKVAEGAHVQARAVESSSGGIEEINASIKGVAESADSLYYSAESTSSSILEMTASIDEIAGSAAVLSSSVDSTVSSISQITASIREVSRYVGVLSDAADTSVESITRVANSIRDVEGAAKESAQLSEKVTTDARRLGMGAMERAIEGMSKIKNEVNRSAEVINRLGGRSRQIGEILNVIDEVTDQTELLSLNAAILASQAGEHGKGFAVVADAIKDLAERTASSTQEISKLIATVQAEASEAVQAMESGKAAVEEGQAVVYQAKDVLEGIVKSSAQSSEMSKRIEDATMEQAEGAKRVAEAMVNTRDIVQSIQRATSELTQGSDQILREADKVKEVARHVRTATAEQSKGSDLIIMAVENTNQQAQHIANAINEQRKGSEDMVRSVERIRDVALENETLASEMGLAVEELARHIEELKDEVGTFRITGAGSEIIKLGLVPLESPAQMYKKFSPLAAYLSRRVGREVVFKLTSSFTDAVKDVGTGVADICYMTPTTYIEAHEHYGVSLLAKAMRNGVPYTHTMIVTRQDSDVKRIEDLKGRTFAFGDEMSTSSYLVPRYMLAKAGVKLTDLREYRFLGHHDDVAKAVLLGELDAGGLRETTANQYKEKGLRFIKTSDDIPEFNFCARPGLDTVLADKLKLALTSLSPRSAEEKLILTSLDKDYTGFIESRDSDYDGVREMVRRIQ
ncbi:MAG: phosphate/phosphite/phosphonate ABC transporter substrate-binding protein [Nitrospirae bacterium]|nr:phosphate/phosphite/phosphonate ABC transporter substrate-binding protein [Nitrospirota bacterium]